MPSLLESNDYDVFDYKHADEPSLTLDEALKKAATLRNSDRSHFHRIVATDSALSGFRVASVSREEVYSDMISRAHKLFARFLNRSRSFR
jgi:hypothetical protein